MFKVQCFRQEITSWTVSCVRIYLQEKTCMTTLAKVNLRKEKNAIAFFPLLFISNLYEDPLPRTENITHRVVIC